MDEADNVARMVESIIGCKWSLAVIRLLRDGVRRPGAIRRRVDGLTTKVLNERLTKLLRFGIIEKRAYPEVPPRVEYHFTPLGRRFLTIIDAVEQVQDEFNRTRPPGATRPLPAREPRRR